MVALRAAPRLRHHSFLLVAANDPAIVSIARSWAFANRHCATTSRICSLRLRHNPHLFLDIRRVGNYTVS
jgi:hypothetical protein